MKLRGDNLLPMLGNCAYKYVCKVGMYISSIYKYVYTKCQNGLNDCYMLIALCELLVYMGDIYLSSCFS
jgi:hypothetical protein